VSFLREEASHFISFFGPVYLGKLDASGLVRWVACGCLIQLIHSCFILMLRRCFPIGSCACIGIKEGRLNRRTFRGILYETWANHLSNWRLKVVWESLFP
jgi:hypothetical protein